MNNEQNNKTEEISKSKSTNKNLTDGTGENTDTKEERKYPSKKKLNKDEKSQTKRKIRSLLQNYFMSRRRFFKMIESKMDRLVI